MDLNPNLDLRYPNFNIKIEQRVQRKMNRFWSGLQPAQCEGCLKYIQWHHSMHTSLKIGGFIFISGVLLIVISAVPLALQYKLISSVCFSFGLLACIAGILSTNTTNDRIKVELIEEA